MKKILALLLCAGMTMGLLAACGSNEAATDASADASAEAVASGDSADEKVWVIASDTSFKPFEYTDENGDFVGIDVDIMNAIAEDQGFKVEIQSLGWDAAIAACQAGQADGMIAGASITEERISNGWIFSDGYYDACQCMAVKDDSDITGFDGLNGKTVGVKTATESAKYAESLMDEYGFTITYYEDSATMYQAVIGGQDVACFDDEPVMVAYIKENNIAMKLIDGTQNDPAQYGMAIFNSDNQELIDMFNAGLANIKANGTYDEIIAKYLGE